jgi:hypothetical protein
MLDLPLVGFVQSREVVFDAADELPDPPDLLIGGRGLGPGPIVEFGGGADCVPGS